MGGSGGGGGTGCSTPAGSIASSSGGDKSATPFLQPVLDAARGEEVGGGGGHGAGATVWYDWFLPETCPDPVEVAQLEEIFHSAGQD